MLKQFTYLKRLTLELKVIHIFHMTLLISRLYAYYWLDLGVDSNILNVEDLKKTQKSATWPWWLTLIFEGQTIFFWNYYYFQDQPS